ncbi:MAG: NusG domain II-containing protein [Oscillospiraceae bacterium]|nr:NusG domain II-containing protein [Oscillospiraceae bacterium]MBQ3561099.1 NusG domain II-containing protein [Oscillospiraceae bacterium]MBQ4117477.1 NusG domain II-containing protein [Oscillospiraceae bacterium]MBQ6699082.1 NusG domain II-containing protein [Oscillospiraceae bacterium]
MNMFKDKKTRNDIILALAVIIAAAGIWLFSELVKEEGAFAVVTVKGIETARYPLDTDAEIRLESENGGYNILIIKDGKADVTEASCPDHVCVDQRAVGRTGEAITCLPNKTVITIEGFEEAEVDFVS